MPIDGAPHEPRPGDLVVYRLRYSLEYSDLLGTVVGVDPETSVADVMWMDQDGTPLIRSHPFHCLKVVEDERMAHRIKEERCRGID